MTDEKEFFELGKKMFDRLNPHISHNPKVVGPAQEPVAWMVYTQDGQSVYVTDNQTDIQESQRALPLYTSPPKREWVGLTDAEVDEIYEQVETLVHDSWAGNGTVGLMFPITLYKMLEAKLKEKNT
jgi:hypothetical protein